MAHADRATTARGGTPTRTGELGSALRDIRYGVPELTNLLGYQNDKVASIDVERWQTVLDTRLIPMTDPEFPLLVAVCGGGSAGKSTLFNALLGKKLSAAGGKAGLTRRVLAAVHPAVFGKKHFMQNLFHPFGIMPSEITHPDELAKPGPPLYVQDEAVPESLVLLDTPDFDTGTDEAFINRHVVRPVLEAADLLVYAFTNATYNNRENTRFMARMLTECGRKDCVLIYRTYDSFPDDEVRDHAITVAANLYGDCAENHVRGVYRVADSNEIASGRENPIPRPLEGGTPLMDFIGNLDPQRTRASVLAERLNRLHADVSKVTADFRTRELELELYDGLCRLAESRAVRRATTHLPQREITDKAVHHWLATRPWTLKALRGLGRTVSAPLRGLLWLGRKAKTAIVGEAKKEEDVDVNAMLKQDLLKAASNLRRALLSSDMSEPTTIGAPDGQRLLEVLDQVRKRKETPADGVPRREPAPHDDAIMLFAESHPGAKDRRDRLRSLSWESIHGEVENVADAMNVIPDTIDAEIRQIIEEFRATMGFWQWMREFFVSSLEALPVVVGVTYVFVTYDPAGGATIAQRIQSMMGLNQISVWARIGGLFGAKDLYAVVTLPASLGLSKGDREQLQGMLGPVYSRWLSHRSGVIRSCLQEHVTGMLLPAVELAREETAEHLEALTSSLAIIDRVRAELSEE